MSDGLVPIRNIIGAPSIPDIIRVVDVMHTQPCEFVVLDPGKMVGWASCISRGVYEHGRLIGDRISYEVGQAPWHAARDFRAKQVWIERTPYAARRTFDAWPLYYTGMVISAIHPQEPRYLLPTSLKIAEKWYSVPRNSGLGPHAKDALTHLIYVLVSAIAKK